MNASRPNPGAAGGRRLLARAGVLAVLVWVGLVLVGSTMVWAVISRAGREVASVGEPRNVAASRATSFPRHVQPSSSPLHRQHTPGGGGHHQGSSAAGTVDPSTPETSSEPGDPSSTSSPGGDGTSAPPSSSAPSTPNGPQPQRATSSGRGGSVTVECTGAQVTDYNIVPDSGFSAHAEKESASMIKVEFEPRGEGENVEVTGYCQGGSPKFERSNGGADDGAGESASVSDDQPAARESRARRD